ncbi:hypothetical protein FHY56_04310 [Brucella gallinifaecis]|uniref:Uncharacterized protein n=1 Tax=Brucella gallinifaecis TaxID=215590 RepID=A0A502BUS0_9HYPH|nr:hypothetical protein FHY56_04310 [Brucella gallinifaecis]
MPFRSADYRGNYNPNELALLQDAYNRCCELLGRCPATHKDRDRLARAVMRTFEDSKHDPEIAAQRAAELAKLIE